MKILMRKGLLYGFIFTSFFSCESNELVKQDHELGFKNQRYFFEGKPYTGKIISHRDVGYLLSSKNIVEGYRDGQTEYFYENGHLERIENYSTNLREGETVIYFENKMIHQKLNFKNDQKVGDYEEWLIDGTRFILGEYQNDLKTNTWYYFLDKDTLLIESMDSKGAVLKRNTSSKYILTETIGRDTLTFSILDSNKNELVKGSYLNDLKSGLFQFKINDKELNINYKKNKREGEFEYRVKGTTYMKGIYQNDKKEGQWRFLDENRFESIGYNNDYLR